MRSRFRPTAKTVYVTDGDALLRLNAATLRVTGRIRVGANWGIALLPDGKTLYTLACSSRPAADTEPEPDRPERAYRWVENSSLAVAATVTVVTGATAEEVLLHRALFIARPARCVLAAGVPPRRGLPGTGRALAGRSARTGGLCRAPWPAAVPSTA